MAIVADTRTGWFGYYNAVMALLKSGWLTIRLPEIDRVMKVYMKEYTKYSQLTILKKYRSADRRIYGNAARTETFFK